MRGALDPEEDGYCAEFVSNELPIRNMGNRLAARRPAAIGVLEYGALLNVVAAEHCYQTVMVEGATTLLQYLCDEAIRLTRTGRSVECIWLFGERAEDRGNQLATALLERFSLERSVPIAPAVLTLSNEAIVSPGEIDDAVWLTSFSGCMVDMNCAGLLNELLDSNRMRARVIRATTADALLEATDFCPGREHVLLARPPRSFRNGRGVHKEMNNVARSRNGDAWVLLFTEEDPSAAWLSDEWLGVALSV